MKTVYTLVTSRVLVPQRVYGWAILALLVCPALKAATTLSRVEVSGDKVANIILYAKGKPFILPAMNIVDNVVELNFQAMEMDNVLEKKLELLSPHVLIHRISAYEPAKGEVKAKVVVNGSIEKLRERLTLSKLEDGYQLSVAFPEKGMAALKLLEEEQQSLVTEATPKSSLQGEFRWGALLVSILVIFMLSIGGMFLLGYLKKKGKFGGSRKYLIEQLSFIPIGSNTKTGIALIKVGQEFYLLGVTPNQITFLATPSKLQAQYSEESRFERKCFSDAVEEEFRRITVSQPKGNNANC